MIVNSTEMQNNFGKYLKISQYEDIIVARNGINLAKMIRYNDYSENHYEDITVLEEARKYHVEKKKMEYDEFIELTKESENQYEFIDGQIYLMSSPGVSHQMIQTKIMSNFYGWFSGKKCIPFTAPFDIILTKQSGSKNVVQPDILVICDINEKTDKEDRYQGTPELVLEIMSKTSKRKDMILKLDLYFQTGIKEYWLVDPFLKTIAVYKFENREISDLSVFKGTETAHSFIFKGLKVELEKIF